MAVHENGKASVENKNMAGRPREHDRDQIADDLVEWAKLPDSINLNGFCCSREPPLNPRRLADWSKECTRFRGAYETAKAFLGNRREIMLNMETLHVKAYDLNAKTYDFFLNEQAQKNSEFEAALAQKTAPSYTEEELSKLDSVLEQLSSIKENRKSSRTNNSKDI